jgi:hypothetical protein
MAIRGGLAHGALPEINEELAAAVDEFQKESKLAQ